MLRCPCDRPKCRGRGPVVSSRSARQHLTRLGVTHMRCPCMQCNSLFLHPVSVVIEHLALNAHATELKPDSVLLSDDLEDTEEVPDPRPLLNRNGLHVPAFIDHGGESSEHDDLEVDEDTSIALRCQQFSREVLNEVAGGVGQTVAVRVINALRVHLGTFLPVDMVSQLPRTVYMLKKKAEVTTVTSFRRHFCPYGCRMFSGESGEQEACGLCEFGWRYDDHGEPTCENLYFSLDDWSARMHQIDVLSEALDSWAMRAQSNYVPGVFRDSTDGHVLRNFFAKPELQGMLNSCLPFAQCNDGVVMYVNSARSMTPVIFHCHALV